jgi:hypothetical protein
MTGISVQDLLRMSLDWKKAAPGRWEAVAKGTRCTLVMNNFPEEPLYTVAMHGESMDLDDPPPSWRIE